MIDNWKVWRHSGKKRRHRHCLHRYCNKHISKFHEKLQKVLCSVYWTHTIFKWMRAKQSHVHSLKWKFCVISDNLSHVRTISLPNNINQQTRFNEDWNVKKKKNSQKRIHEILSECFGDKTWLIMYLWQLLKTEDQ